MNRDRDSVFELAEMNGMMFVVLDPFGHIERISSSVSYRLGIDIGMVRNRRFAGMFVPEYPDVIRSIEKALDTGYTVNLPELPVPCMEETPRRLSWRLKAVSDGHGHITEIWCVGKEAEPTEAERPTIRIAKEDIRRKEWELEKASDAVKTLYIEMEQKKLHAERLNRATNRFLGRISHELRLPTNTISGFSRLLLDSPLMPLQKLYVNSIEKNAGILSECIEDLLDISKSESDHLDVELIEFDLVHLIENTIEHVRSRIDPAKVRLTYRFESAIPMSLRGDPGRIRQILLNLLSNAAKNTDEGEIGIRVEVCRDIDQSRMAGPCRIALTVSDTGHGIPPDRCAAIQRLFTETDDLKKAADEEIGLGLLVTHAIARRIGGKLGFETVEGRGSSFSVTLELEIVHPVSDLSIVPVSRQAIRNRHVMIVSPEPDVQRIVRGYCEHIPMVVADPLTNLLEMQEYLSGGGQVPDLLIVSVEMAMMNGFEFIRWIREEPGTARIPAVAISGNPRPGMARKAQNAGFNAFLSQPLREEDLVMVIQTVFGDRRDNGRIITRYLANELYLKGMNVLLADANPIDRKHTQDVLSGFGIDVEAVETAEALAERVGAREYEAVLVDSRLLTESEATYQVEVSNARLGLLDMDRSDESASLPLRAREWIERPVEPSVLREKLVMIRRKIEQRREVAP